MSKTHFFGNKPYRLDNLVPLDKIEVRADQRPIDQKTVDSLAASMDKQGFNGHIVLSDRLGSERRVLICGRHRLESARQLGWGSIPAHIVEFKTETEERLCVISENLARAELSRLDRARQITEWRRITGTTIAPDEDGEAEAHSVSGMASVRETAKATGENREDVRRSAVIDNITTEAEPTIRELGLENDQSALFEIGSAVPTQDVSTVQPATTPQDQLTEAQIESAKVLAGWKESRRQNRLKNNATHKAAAERIIITPSATTLGIKFGDHPIIHLPRDVWDIHAKKIAIAVKTTPPVEEKPRRLTEYLTVEQIAWIEAGETETTRRLKARLDKDLSQTTHNKYSAMFSDAWRAHTAPTTAPVSAPIADPAPIDPPKLAALDASVSAHKAANAKGTKKVTLAASISDSELAWINSGKGKLAKELKTLLVSGDELSPMELTERLFAMRSAMKATVVNAPKPTKAKVEPVAAKSTKPAKAEKPIKPAVIDNGHASASC
jgi:hypothetical protein